MERNSTESCVDRERTLESVGLIGCSHVHRKMVDELQRFAIVDAPVLLCGPTGTGKELAARAIHYLSARRGGPFVPIDCGALPETLFEGEVFGHARGAFTDARRDRRGLIAQAERGTIFIDEIHTLTKRSQAALLRFLQDRTYRPLGSERTYTADVRIIAATNKSLEHGIQQDWFRDDLYYRLNVATVALPSLGERTEDIPLLVRLFLSRLSQRYQMPPKRFDSSALAWMASRPWQGNVRELENFVHRELLRSDCNVITLDFILSHVSSETGVSETLPPAFSVARAAVLARFERDYIRTLLVATGGNVSEAARRAGKERRVFGRMMKRNQIERDDFRWLPKS
jgi:two-component system, NtrC family, response regulator GlrR